MLRTLNALIYIKMDSGKIWIKRLKLKLRWQIFFLRLLFFRLPNKNRWFRAIDLFDKVIFPTTCVVRATEETTICSIMEMKHVAVFMVH